MLRPAAAAMLTILTTLPLQAQTLPEALSGATEIPVEEWRSMAEGRTLVYRIAGSLFALEHYYPDSDRVSLELMDGTCLHGTWVYAQPNYCFFWSDQAPVCFRHARKDGEILVLQSPDTGTGGEVPLQHMSAVTDIPLTCEQEPEDGNPKLSVVLPGDVRQRTAPDERIAARPRSPWDR